MSVKVITSSGLKDSNKESNTPRIREHVISHIVINRPALVNNGPKQLTLSVSVPGKQSLESYLRVEGFRIEGERERDPKQHKEGGRKERKRDREIERVEP